MNKSYFNVLIIVLIEVIIISSICCASKPPQQPMPIIYSFSATPTEINPGQWTALEWSTSGAETITISPEIKGVGLNGSLRLSPGATTTYVLTATNEAGSTTASVIVTVIPVDTGKPDLIITDIFCEFPIIHYKIKNQGNAVARPSRSQLIQPVPSSKVIDWVDYLDAGEEINKSLSNYVEKYGGSCGCGRSCKICADIDNEVEESNEDNNCLTQVAH